MQDNQPPADSNTGPECMVCPSCLNQNPFHVDYCEDCGAPLSPTVNFDPYKRIASQGWLYRTASSEARRRITVIGMWLIFGPMIGAILSFAYLIDYKNSKSWLVLVGLLVLCAIPAIILFKTTRNYFRNRARMKDIQNEE